MKYPSDNATAPLQCFCLRFSPGTPGREGEKESKLLCRSAVLRRPLSERRAFYLLRSPEARTRGSDVSSLLKLLLYLSAQKCFGRVWPCCRLASAEKHSRSCRTTRRHISGPFWFHHRDICANWDGCKGELNTRMPANIETIQQRVTEHPDPDDYHHDSQRSDSVLRQADSMRVRACDEKPETRCYDSCKD